jgi:hypothetical protein
MFKIIDKVKFLVFCWYKGHKFGTVKFHSNFEETICARCGYKKKRKFKNYKYEDDFFIY